MAKIKTEVKVRLEKMDRGIFSLPQVWREEAKPTGRWKLINEVMFVEVYSDRMRKSVFVHECYFTFIDHFDCNERGTTPQNP